MEQFTKLFGSLLALVYHCFDRVVILGQLPRLTRPENIVHFFRDVHGVGALSKEVLRQRTTEYQQWVEAFARNRQIPIEWAEKGVRKEDHVRPRLRPLDYELSIHDDRGLPNDGQERSCNSGARAAMCTTQRTYCANRLGKSIGREGLTIIVTIIVGRQMPTVTRMNSPQTLHFPLFSESGGMADALDLGLIPLSGSLSPPVL